MAPRKKSTEAQIWLNIGCGEFKAPAPWINVDSNDGRQADVVASALDLPYANKSVDALYAGHIIEHLDYDLEVPVFLSEIKRLMKPTGKVMIVAPDYDRAIKLVGVGLQPPQLLDDIRKGGERWNGDCHQWTATADLIAAALDRAHMGYEETTPEDVNEKKWPLVSQTAWQCCFYTEAGWFE